MPAGGSRRADSTASRSGKFYRVSVRDAVAAASAPAAAAGSDAPGGQVVAMHMEPGDRRQAEGQPRVAGQLELPEPNQSPAAQPAAHPGRPVPPQARKCLKFQRLSIEIDVRRVVVVRLFDKADLRPVGRRAPHHPDAEAQLIKARRPDVLAGEHLRPEQSGDLDQASVGSL
jgi:hypothetical protein